ncbi:MAG: AMP-binding protein [Hyphomicrobiaceae bacterium]
MIRSIADIRALEAGSFDTLCPNRSAHSIIEASAKQWPDRTAIHYLADATDPKKDQRWSFSELHNGVMASARIFRAAGVSSDNSVAILANHTPLAQIALWGAQVAGRACPINPLLRPDHIAELFKAANVAAVVMMGANREQDYWNTLVPALRDLRVEAPIFDCDADCPSPGSAGSFETLFAAELGRPLGFEMAGDDCGIAALYHTGGTTGAPKLVRHTRLNEAHVARSCAVLHGYGPDDVVVNGFPLFHVAGAFVYGLSILSSGGTLLVPGRLGMRNAAFMGDFWRQAERTSVTVIGGVPTLLSGLMGQPVDADISNIRLALTGGSPLPPELADSFEAKTGIPVRNIFGMTETAGSIALESAHAERTPHCCGFPLPFSEIAILPHNSGDADISAQLPVGETGIVAVRGPNVSPGYTEASRNAGTFLDEGWLLTGDLGRLDEEGRLYLTGREKDVIIRGSHNIDPQSIEDALLAHPNVEVAAAVGMPDSYAGELPVAFVSLRAGSHVSANELLDFLKPRIEEPAAMPKRLEIVETMPLTPIGKIFKPSLRQKAIHWAIADAAVEAGIPSDSYMLDVNDKLECRLRVDEPYVDKIKESIVGMPISIIVEVR